MGGGRAPNPIAATRDLTRDARLVQAPPEQGWTHPVGEGNLLGLPTAGEQEEEAVPRHAQRTGEPVRLLLLLGVPETLT